MKITGKEKLKKMKKFSKVKNSHRICLKIKIRNCWQFKLRKLNFHGRLSVWLCGASNTIFGNDLIIKSAFLQVCKLETTQISLPIFSRHSSKFIHLKICTIIVLSMWYWVYSTFNFVYIDFSNYRKIINKISIN